MDLDTIKPGSSVWAWEGPDWGPERVTFQLECSQTRRAIVTRGNGETVSLPDYRVFASQPEAAREAAETAEKMIGVLESMLRRWEHMQLRAGAPSPRDDRESVFPSAADTPPLVSVSAPTVRAR